MEYRNIIFDFDGTLADTAAFIVEVMHRTIQVLHLPERNDAECRSTIGYRLEEVPARLWPEAPDLSEQYAKTYREVFNSLKGGFKVKLYPNVRETLSTLHHNGVNMAIASSRSKASLQEYIDGFGISHYFQRLVGGEDVREGKPSPDPANTVLSLQHWSNKETLVVGDMGVDILMGKGAGTATCGVTYGNGSRDELTGAGADHIIDDFGQLL